jgi:hypothetical protein
MRAVVRRPIYGLIFLFKWQNEVDNRKPDPKADSVFFAKQVCAASTQSHTRAIEVGVELTRVCGGALCAGDQ